MPSNATIVSFTLDTLVHYYLLRNSLFILKLLFIDQFHILNDAKIYGMITSCFYNLLHYCNITMFYLEIVSSIIQI